MAFFNYSTMQMTAKIVYYGPGLCGKTTNLQYIYGHTVDKSRGTIVGAYTFKLRGKVIGSQLAGKVDTYRDGKLTKSGTAFMANVFPPKGSTSRPKCFSSGIIPSRMSASLKPRSTVSASSSV